MGGVLTVFLFNSIIIVIILLWLITFLGFNFRKNFVNKEKYDVYECGFKTINNFNLELNYSTIIISMFLVLYEFEMFLLVPFFFNVDLWNYNNVIIIAIYLFSINMTLILDLKFNTLKWTF